jgi:hypothetical protein
MRSTPVSEASHPIGNTPLSAARRPQLAPPLARPIPPTSELFTKRQLVERHPNLLSESRVAWAVRNRDENGLADSVYESRGGKILIHEPGFLAWFLGLKGTAKPRTLRR